MNILYFAWLRQKIGTDKEALTPPADVTTVAGLIDWLKDRSPGHADAFENAKFIRAAVNQEFATPDTPVGQGDEVAFFPPVTGG